VAAPEPAVTVSSDTRADAAAVLCWPGVGFSGAGAATPDVLMTRRRLVRNRWSDHRHDVHEGIQTSEIVRARGKQRQPFGDGGGRDHQVGGSSARLVAGRENRSRHPSEDAGGLHAERNRIKLAFRALQRDACAAG
jgi:hypothetical protein